MFRLKLSSMLFVVFVSLNCSVQNITSIDNEPDLQTSYVEAATGRGHSDAVLRYLSERSTLIVTGSVKEVKWVVDPEKMSKDPAFAQHEERREISVLPRPDDWVLGLFIVLDVTEVIHSQADNKAGLVSIYVPGGYRSTESGTPRFLRDKNYLVFLSSAKKEDVVAGAEVIQPADLSQEKFTLNHKKVFTVTSGAVGQRLINDTNKNLVKKTKSIVREVKRDSVETKKRL
ncbi:MAG: hypothetical protein R2684_13125 [Pyrinomonadaceae bacterium]